jgi:APA family basic amino acid/polyamine antiporter
LTAAGGAAGGVNFIGILDSIDVFQPAVPEPATAAFVAIAAGILPIDALLHLTNIGTLFAFVIVCAAVLVMRKTNPNAERPFRCPLVPVVPALGILMCLTMMFSLPAANWLRLIVWLGIGFVIYFMYGIHHSKLKQRMDAGQA